jgi:VWFA-related protein
MGLRAIPISRTAAFIAALCLASGPPAAPAAQEFQIRARIDLVVVPVSVKNGSRKLISDLGKENFTIYEDGRQQTIVNFSTDPVPMSAAVVIDTGLAENTFSAVRDSFPSLAAAFSPLDEVAVYRFDNRVDKIVDFTNDSLLVELALKTLKESRSSNTTLSSGPFSTMGPTINGIPVLPAPVISQRSTTPAKKTLHDALFTAAEDLGHRAVERRRVVFIVTDAQDKGSKHSLKEAISRLLDQGIQVYGAGMDSAFLSRGLSALDSYSGQTGGDSCYVNSLKALERCYAQNAEEARYQYVLGYVSDRKVTGRLPVFRKIDVHVDREGLEASHRAGYYQYP